MGAAIFFSKLSLKIVLCNGALRHTAEAWWGTNRPRLAEWTRMYRSTRCVSPRHILWCSHLIYRPDKLTLYKIDLKIQFKVFDVAILSSNNSLIQCTILIPLLIFFLLIAQNCIVLNLNTLTNIKPFLNLA